MKREISDRYEPKSVETKWIDFWEKNHCFSPDLTGNGSFSLVLPPPNVTGFLHIGHALNHTLQDIITRLERKKGKATLWAPGMDHAGIATQVVVEKQLAEKGQKRTDFTREEFEKKIWEWKETSGGQIQKQQKLLGESVDWDRARFTLDEGFSKAVVHVFKKLYDEGLIYKGERIINWCPVTLTAISDLEVEYKETKGKLYHVRYPFADGDGYLVVATTRPETMLGDVAVCAHPEDPRYQKFKGRNLKLPLTDRTIPLLFDSFVDKDFGSGLVKITPAHDVNDFEAGQRLGLEPINIMNPDASLNQKAGSYAGLDRFVARKKIVEDLESQGLIEKIEDYTHSVGHNQRGGAVIEPYLSTQWFVKIEPLARPAIQAVRDGRTEFIPKMWEKTYFEWMENIRDWCISRQLWWGHRIPAYYCGDCGHMEVSEEEVTYCPKCKSENVEQDPDVLDTWFSSGLWPFAIFGWPNKTDELSKFYPTSVLVTGFDIIFFWVARMMMMGLKFMGDVPFKQILIHGLVRDKEGKKFSKSKGNVVDPLEMMDKYGTDSFRFFLAATLPEGKDILFDESRLDGYRSFCNKIWNSSRFILMNLDENFTPRPVQESELENTDLWIYSRFNECLRAYTKAYSKYHFYEMAQTIYEFIWGDFCDWYIELTKPRVYGKRSPKSAETAKQVLSDILIRALHLLNPLMPFITEEIHSAFSNDDLVRSPLPSEFPITSDSQGVRKIAVLQEIITRVRTMRADLQVAPDKKCQIILVSKDPLITELVSEQKEEMMQLGKAELLESQASYDVQKTDAVGGFSLGEVVLPLSGLIDFEKEKARLSKEKEKLQQEIDKLEKKLSNENFLSKANPEVVEKEKEKLRLHKENHDVVMKGLEKLNA